MKHIPNTISLINLFMGCLALVFIFESKLVIGAYLILACSLLDYFDGAAARLLNAYSETGKQLDSLADLISFGMAPAGILFYYYKNSIYNLNPEGMYIVLPSLAFLIAVFSALRLARFNVEEESKDYFTGLPTPANALLIASMPLTIHFTNKETFMHTLLMSVTENSFFILFFILLLSFLLISPIRMFSLKIKSLKWKDNRIRIIFLTGCLMLLITFGGAALPLFLIFYILLSAIWPAVLPRDFSIR